MLVEVDGFCNAGHYPWISDACQEFLSAGVHSPADMGRTLPTSVADLEAEARGKLVTIIYDVLAIVEPAPPPPPVTVAEPSAAVTAAPLAAPPHRVVMHERRPPAEPPVEPPPAPAETPGHRVLFHGRRPPRR